MINFEAAKRAYTNRFTMEHVLTWALKRPCDCGGTAPLNRTRKAMASDWESCAIDPGDIVSNWFGYTEFGGETGNPLLSRHQR